MLDYLSASDIRQLLVHASTQMLLQLPRNPRPVPPELRDAVVPWSEVREDLEAQQRFFLQLPDDDPRLLTLEGMHFAGPDAWVAAVDEAIPDDGVMPVDGARMLAYLISALG
jgi:hypothetical protein